MSFNDYIEATRKAESNAIAASSLQTYEGYLNSYKNTMESLENAPPPYPITEEKIRGFLHYKLNVCSNKIEYNTFKLFVASFSHYFMINNLHDVTKNKEFRTYKKSIQRTLGTSPHKDKKPITKEFMIAISQKIDKTIFEEVRFFTAMSFAFYGFLRFSELRNLKMNDIKIENDGICLTITQSKEFHLNTLRTTKERRKANLIIVLIHFANHFFLKTMKHRFDFIGMTYFNIFMTKK